MPAATATQSIRDGDRSVTRRTLDPARGNWTGVYRDSGASMGRRTAGTQRRKAVSVRRRDSWVEELGRPKVLGGGRTRGRKWLVPAVRACGGWCCGATAERRTYAGHRQLVVGQREHLGRPRAPLATHAWPITFLVRHLAEGTSDDLPWVHPRVQHVDGLALAGAVSHLPPPRCWVSSGNQWATIPVATKVRASPHGYG